MTKEQEQIRRVAYQLGQILSENLNRADSLVIHKIITSAVIDAEEYIQTVNEEQSK